MIAHRDGPADLAYRQSREFLARNGQPWGSGRFCAPGVGAAPTARSACEELDSEERSASISVLALITLALLTVLASMASAQPAASQPGHAPAAAPADTLQTTVTLFSKTAEAIRLIKDKTATIHTNVPIDRVDVASRDIADVPPVVSPQELLVIGKGIGATQITLWTADGQQKVFDVVVELDVPLLEAAIKQMSPLSRVQARMFAGSLILNGRVPNALTAERIVALATLVHPRVVNHLETSGVQQAVLRCTVAEVNREAIRQLSVNWAMGGADWTRGFFMANNLNQLNPTVFGDNGLTNLVAPNSMGGQLTYNRVPTANGTSTNFTFGFPKAELQFFLQALRENNLFRILAEPNVVAVNGQEASFLSGGEFPIPVTQGGATAGAITIEYRQFGILLRFTPTMLENGLVRMRVGAELSDLVPQSGGVAGGLPVFSLSTRRVESTVEVGNGQTFALGGLLSDRVQAMSSKIPGLGDIPVLGTLFSSVRYQRNETELVVLVTPELVEPMDIQQVPPVPGQDMADPDDFELFGLQQLEGRKRPDVTQETGAPRHRYPPLSRPERAAAAPAPAPGLRGVRWGQSDKED